MNFAEDLQELNRLIAQYRELAADPEAQLAAHMTRDMLLDWQAELYCDMLREAETGDPAVNRERAILFRILSEQFGDDFLDHMERKEQMAARAEEEASADQEPLDLELAARQYTLTAEGTAYLFCPVWQEICGEEIELRLELHRKTDFQAQRMTFHGTLSPDGTFPVTLLGQPMRYHPTWGLFRWVPPFDPKQEIPHGCEAAILDHQVIRLKAAFARACFSQDALKLAFAADDTHILWSVPDGRYNCLRFELPRLFPGSDLSEILDAVSRYCPDYLDAVCGTAERPPFVLLAQNDDRPLPDALPRSV